MTERLPFHFLLSCIGEGNGNPLQGSCLENPRNGGAWWEAIYGVTQTRTWLRRLSSSSRYWLGNWSVSHRTPATLWCATSPFSWLLPPNTKISTVQRAKNFLFVYLSRSILQGAMRDKVNGFWKDKDKKFFEYFNNTRIWGNIFILKNVSFWLSNWVSVGFTHYNAFSISYYEDTCCCFFFSSRKHICILQRVLGWHLKLVPFT